MATKTSRGSKFSDRHKLLVEKAKIESRFTCFKCKPINSRTTKLECFGTIQPTAYSVTYTVRLEYEVWGIPRIYVVEPEIIPAAKIHVYKEGNLCLYYPKETPWKPVHHISDTILPWAAEWLVFYELFKITGKWLGKSALHNTADKHD